MSPPRFRRVPATAALAAAMVLAGSACADDVTPALSTEETMAESDSRIPEAQPGGEAFGDELRARLAGALAGRGPDYVPRTRHRREDGSPLYSNRLLLQTSPYLRQHAHNPVNWYPWGEEAFAAAKRLGRPVLLSIGYSTCHWCHVMEEESFEDVEIATFLNSHYIAIKVDREVRPDVDAIYMSAVTALTGSGGWPLNVWLTPEGRPFFGGTYFPARDGDRGARHGFLTIIREIERSYREQPDRVAQATAQLTEVVRSRLGRTGAPATATPGDEVLRLAFSFYSQGFDAEHGGLRGAPKFPSTMPVRLLLRYHRRTGSDEALRMAALTLEKMAAGGMYDQIGGGFHRYSVDPVWLVPHFEKMLYDNALLAVAYLEGWQATGRDDFAAVTRDILDYVDREMTAPGGAFYSATDADSLNPRGHAEEGWFFTWTPAELRSLLGEDQARFIESHYGVTEAGNFEGRNILHRARPAEVIARVEGKPLEEVRTSLDESRRAMYTERLKRPAPLRDDKILTAWNGLMISAFARAGAALPEERYVAKASAAASFVLDEMREKGRLYRSFNDGRPEHAAYLEDYAFLIAALIDLYEAEGNPRWLREALSLQAVLDEQYADEEGGGYFTTADDAEKLLAREKPSYDGAEPSGNSVAVMNLVRLHELTTRDAYRAFAEKTLRGFADVLNRAPAALSEMLLALDFHTDAAKEIILVTPAAGGDTRPFLERLGGAFVPNRVTVVLPEGEGASPHAELVPLVRGKTAKDGRVTAYVCRNGVCDLPTTDPEVFAAQIDQVEPLTAAGGEPPAEGRPREDD